MVNEDEDPTNFLAMPQEIALALASRSNGTVKFWDNANNGPTQDIEAATFQAEITEKRAIEPPKRKRNSDKQNMDSLPTTMEVTDLSSVCHNTRGEPVEVSDIIHESHTEDVREVQRSQTREVDQVPFVKSNEMALNEGITLLNADSDDVGKLTSALEKCYNVICYL